MRPKTKKFWDTPIERTESPKFKTKNLATMKNSSLIPTQVTRSVDY